MERTANGRNFSKYLALMGIGFLFSMGVLISINVMVDPAHILADQSLEQRMAEAVTRGQNLRGASNFNERLFQLFRIQLVKKSPDRIVLGSSRALQIRDGMLPGRTFNNAVNGAVIEDYYAIIQLYRHRNILPKKVVLVADGWIFNASHRQSRWIVLRAQCHALAQSLSVPGLCPPGSGGLSKPWKAMVSLGYLSESIKRLWRDGTKAIGQSSISIAAVSSLPSNAGGFLADGSILYPKKFRDESLGEVKLAAVQYAKSTPVYSLGNYSRLEPIYKRSFDALLSFLAAQGVTVSIILPPYQPTAARLLQKDPKYAPRLHEAEAFIRTVAKKYGISVRGGYFSNICGPGEFFDGMHARSSCMAKLLNGRVPEIYIFDGNVTTGQRSSQSK